MFDFLKGINSNFIYIIAFVIAFVIACFTTPLSKKFAYKVGAIDMPKARGMNTKPMPLAGGISIVLGFLVTIALIAPSIKDLELIHLIGLIIGGVVITIVGLLDDIYDLPAKLKLFFQILAALIVIITGTTIHAISWPWAPGGVLLLGSFSNVITIIWIIGVTNAVNLIDGLDGLATGVSSIAALCLMFISILNGEPTAVLLTAALAGSCLGFLPHNFNPATIYMGDTGSTFLGFTLSVISIQGFIKSYTAITIIVAVLILGLPIFDTFFAILRRIANGKPVMQADRGHLHHRLVDRGYSHKRAVLTLYGISGGFGIAGILIAMNDIMFALIIIGLILVVWLLDFIARRIKNK
ncbi:glycosyltransferase family 4 protein [Vallitalea guaymasensis]|uniref:Undecaprenyl/decaprenyl-phosphate alpha-N-acetylglucosaminyl 1-phosphate transferase n=1 Tax=Vallitalea guaymasensis TaxID=1185412 RepID=A0A8J8MAV0_9FIRM|nr:MraY family glycosyltransferase [Vallitalea guaymasensis]QUH29511.1 undecaprenyl/decaprenyl-phosphate alpha-N-acetylglucosaminyl 1-phosphate transferase [Vallitalea guaymasensis]